MSKSNIEHTLPLFRHTVVFRIYHRKCHVISRALKQPEDILDGFRMAVCQHPAYIFREKKFRLKFFQDPDIVEKQLSSCILDSFERAGLRP